MSSVSSAICDSHEKHVTLSNNVQMPLLGLGTSHSGGFSHDTLVFALHDCGYRLIDTAKRYGVEANIAKAVQESEVKREDVFLSTKCWPTDYGTDTTTQAFNGSCERLQTEYLDLYLLHWPVVSSLCTDRPKLLRQTWRELELLLDAERVRAIGVSNFTREDLDILLDDEELSICPHVNQCEFHPYHNKKDIRNHCQELGIQFQGFCPLGSGTLLKDPLLNKIASRCGKSVSQVLIRWNVQQNVVCIPKSTKKERVLENSQVFDFSLSPEEMDELSSFPQSLNVFDRDTIQHKVDNPQPDGYKLTQ